MIPSEQFTVYDWFDVQKAISDELNIEDKYFRCYHEIIGGDYKDLWLVALESVVPEHMANGTIVNMFVSDWGDDLTGKKKWQKEFFVAYNKVMKALDPKDAGVWVHFAW